MPRNLIRLLSGMLFSLFLIYPVVHAQGQGSPNVPLLAHFNNYSSVGYNDCWGYTAPDGREYALLGVVNGTSIVDITDPANIYEVTFIPSASSTWKDIKTYQHYAYTVNESSGGLQIIDLSDLPNSATLVNTYTGFSTSHNIHIDVANAMLYAEGSSSEPVRAISLADPVNPVQLSAFGIECHDIYSRDNIVYVAEGNSGSVGIFDLSTPGSPALLARINVPNSGYVHNCWLSDDGNYLMTTEETPGKTIKYWNISDLNQPVITSQYLGPSGLAHNAHIKGDYAYISHYADGLRIVDISDPNNIFEAGYYDTYIPPSTTFDGAWGAFPFFSSGKVLISDMTSGLYVVFFEGAADADSLDPNPPSEFTAYSDYSMPSSMLLSWTDPGTFFGGDPLPPSDFTIEILRDDTPIASVPGGTENFTDSGLSDGQLYEYTIYAKVTASDSVSREVTASWIAGGSPIPDSPTGFYVTESGGDFMMHWSNPAANIDGTPMDDFAGINLYEDGVLRLTLSKSSADTGTVDSALYSPTPGTHQYYVTAFDSETPVNESDPSNSGYSPLALPFFDNFPSAPMPNPAFWINTDAAVTTNGVNPPSAPNVLELNGDPGGGDVVALLPVDLSNSAGDGLILSYHYQPQGTGNAPETQDSLILEFLNDQGDWKLIRSYPGTNVVPFVNEVISIDSENPGPGATFFHPVFQFRFRNYATAGNFDLWLIDDVFLGLPSADPQMVVSLTELDDSIMVGAVSMQQFSITNAQGTPSSLNYSINENPPVGWLAVSPASGTIPSGDTHFIDVAFDAGGLAVGSYSTQLIVTGNDPNNPQHTISVSLEVLDAPSIRIEPDSLLFTLEQGERDSAMFTIYNDGTAPLNFTLSDEDIVTAPYWTIPPKSYTVPLGLNPAKGEVDVRHGVPPTDGSGGPDAFGYRWTDSDEPGGPSFNWMDISGTGTSVVLGDDDFIEVPLPFTFSFYGVDQTMVKISSNGYLTFGADGTDFSNDPIPDPNDPNDIICPFWDDLNPSLGGTIHYKASPDRFIVQYSNIQHFVGTGTYSFEVILNPDGSMLFQYLTLGGDLASNTIGIENSDASIGLEVIFNAAYVHDNLAIRIASETGWLSENPASGTVAPGDSFNVWAIVNTAGLPDGAYLSRLVVNSNDPVNTILKSPVVTLQVGNVVGIEDRPELPLVFALGANYPNPFNPTTTIPYQLPRASEVKIIVYNMLGQKVRTLLNESKEAGFHSAVWDGRNESGAQVSSGIYLYRIEAGEFRRVRKMILMK
ncbi:MAG: choice-of-anchor B family protein [Calditrichia bacterium]